MGTEILQVSLAVSSAEHLEGSQAWSQQRRTLLEALQRMPDAPHVERVEHAVEGARGGAPEIIAVLANAGVLTALLAVVKAWMVRDKARGVKLRVRKDDREIQLDLGTMDEEKVRALLSTLV